MTIDIESTLRFLVPGFVAIKVFQVSGLRSRRTDLELTAWSVLAAAVIDAAVFGLTLGDDRTTRLFVAVAIAGVAGWLGGWFYTSVASRNPQLKAGLSRRAWDVVLSESHWIQVWTTSGYVIRGWPAIVALDAEADDLDLFLEEPSWIDPESSEIRPMTGADGVLIPEDSIDFVQVLEDVESDELEPSSMAP